jgi:hypothetical protein
MLEKEKLRKADVYSGIIIFLFGAWIVWQASKMPMKDSWGGVQNVWFVSPALFPLFVGGMIMLLGLLLVRTALKTIGLKAFGNTLQWLFSKELFQFLNSMSNLRFYAIATLFLALVYLYIPRIDFFLSAILFLNVFILMFYFDEAELLKKLFFFLPGRNRFFYHLLCSANRRMAQPGLSLCKRHFGPGFFAGLLCLCLAIDSP